MMHLEIIIQSEVSQKVKDQIPYNITYMQNLKYDANEYIYKTETQRTDLWTCGCQGGGEWEREGLGVWD